MRRSLILLPVLASAVLLPFLVLKMGHSFSAANPIFDHPQGLLYIAGTWAVFIPGAFFSTYGWPGLLGILLAFPLFRHVRRSRDRAFLAWSTLPPLLIVLNPLAMRVIEGAKAHSLLFRVLLVAPYFQVLRWWAVRSVSRLTSSPSLLRRLSGIPFVLLAGAALVLHYRDAAQVWAAPEHMRSARRELPEVRAALDYLDGNVKEPSVVLSDPITSYLIPAYTRHYSMTPFNQHSSPADSRTPERIQDSQSVLSAYVPMGETVRLLRKYQVSYLLLNQTWPRTEDPMILPITSPVRLETTAPHPMFHHPLLGRISLVCYESGHHVTVRFGRSLEPLASFFPPYLWQSGAVYKEGLYIPIPPHTEPGTHAARVFLYQVPFTMTMRLKDVFALDDPRDRPPVGQVEIR